MISAKYTFALALMAPTTNAYSTHGKVHVQNHMSMQGGDAAACVKALKDNNVCANAADCDDTAVTAYLADPKKGSVHDAIAALETKTAAVKTECVKGDDAKNAACLAAVKALPFPEASTDLKKVTQAQIKAATDAAAGSPEAKPLVDGLAQLDKAVKGLKAACAGTTPTDGSTPAPVGPDGGAANTITLLGSAVVASLAFLLF